MDKSLFVLLLSGLFMIASGVNQQYYYINRRMSWPEAQSYCRAKYTDLATVDTIDNAKSLVNIVDSGYSGSVWIGLKWADQKRWGWSNGENTLTQYSAWDTNQPNTKACGYLVAGVWRGYDCSGQHYSVCYSESTRYIHVQVFMNWSQAQSYCRQHYTDLVTVHNSVEQDELKSVIPGYSWSWIGAFLDSWEWSDSWIWFFRYWAAGQPLQSAGSGDCVSMSRNNYGKWFHENCDLRHPFICHGSPKSPYRLYQFMNLSMTWPEAQSYCRARFTDLADADSLNDVSRLVNAVDPGYSGSVWIGLYGGTNERWVWSMGEGPISNYSAWSSGEPDGDGECVKSFGGKWFDENCSSILPFVCFSDSTGFVIVSTALTWRDAQSYCRQYHSDLASISSSEQQNLISNPSPLWIGLFLDSWYWSDKWSLSFRYWSSNQTSQSSGSGSCVAMSTTDSGKWSQYSCDLKHPFICYGDDKLIKKQVIRLKFSCNNKCALNDPSLQAAILNEISVKLKSMGLEGDRTIRWMKRDGEEVFQQETEKLINRNQQCSKIK